MAERRKKEPKSTPAAPQKIKKAPRKLDALDQKTLGLIESTATRVRSNILARQLPELKFPTRSLGNVKYDTKVGYFELGRGRKARALRKDENSRSERGSSRTQ
jgi:hypothetical protein